jgi:hypothetical protein
MRHPKPQGQITRGKTAPNRLRRADIFLLRYDPSLLTRQDGDFSRALYVDLGYGAEAITTLEAASRLRKVNPRLGILGVEIDPQRVANAQPFADFQTQFRLGGFNIPLMGGECIRIIRAFNVLRQYSPQDVLPAWAQMAQGVLPGGVLLEGTSTPSGALWVANLLRRQASAQMPWTQEALVFSANFRVGFQPVDFQAVLPKNYIHRVVPGEVMYRFLEDWKSAIAETSPMRVWGQREWFVAAALRLASLGWEVNTRRKWLRKGWLIWKNPPP